MKIYFDEKTHRWRRKDGRFASKKEVQRYTKSNFEIKTTWSYEKIKEIKQEREDIWFNNVVIPFAEKYNLTEDEALKEITKLRNQQYFTANEIDKYQDYLELYRRWF